MPDERPILESYVQLGIQDPEFDQNFTFKLTPSELSDKSLRFTVYDYRRRHKLTPIGHVLYSLKGQELDGGMAIERDLKPQSLVSYPTHYSRTSYERTPKGQIPLTRVPISQNRNCTSLGSLRLRKQSAMERCSKYRGISVEVLHYIGIPL